jgi:geranylgeranyl diphosphate synthase, type I
VLLDRVGEPGLDDGDIAAIQRVLVSTGALDEVERLIDDLTGRAIDAIDAADISAEARDELVELARFVASRDA